MAELCDRDACDIADAVRRKEVRAVDVIEASLARIDERNPALNAMVFVDAERARRVAADVDAAVDAGRDPGLLAGVPLAVKELESFEGWPETRASTVWKDRVATRTTTMTTRLQRAGAVPVGMSASPEVGMLFITTSVLHGPSRNPWDLSRSPGGSSGGSGAALAAGLVPLATGSDSGGSIRVPSAFCGVIGIKGTAGLVSRAPRFSGAANVVHYGPLARCVADLARYLDAVVGVDQGDPASVPAPAVPFVTAIAEMSLRGVRVAVLDDLVVTPDPRVAEQVRAAASDMISAAGMTEVSGVTVSLPDLVTSGSAILLLDANPDEAHLMPELMGNLLKTKGAEDLMAEAIVKSVPNLESIGVLNKARSELNAALAAAFDQCDLLILPTTPVPAVGAEGPMPKMIAGQEVGPAAPVAYTSPFNLSGSPVVAAPAGMVDGLPVGMQIVARRHEDALALAAAAALEKARPWPKLAPWPPPA